MNKKEFLRAVTEAYVVYGWVRLNDHSGVYMPTTKSFARFMVKEHPESTTYNAVVRDNNLYID